MTARRTKRAKGTGLCADCGTKITAYSVRCIPCRHRLRGPEHGSWRGGVVKDSAGYLKEFAPDHPKANLGRYVLQHRLVMERHLGRFLRDGENVHHINGDKLDNRLENLELWVVSQPAGQRVEDQVAWATETLQRYAPDRLIADLTKGDK